MEFRVLGPLEAVGPRGPIRIGSARQRAILAVLVLHVGETVSSDRLMDEVWADDPPSTARHALSVHVAGLRRVLGADRIEGHTNGYRLRAEGSDVDLARFEALVLAAAEASARGDLGTAAEQYTSALALWRGPALSDLDSSSARAERARLDELRAIVLERRIDAELASRDAGDLVPDLRRIVAEMPLREGFRARLMLALYRSGRQAEALESYHEARELLDRELGIEPGQELEALQRAVLTHDPVLDLARPRGILGRTATAPTVPATGAAEPPLIRATVSALELPTIDTPGSVSASPGAPALDRIGHGQHASRRTVTATYVQIDHASDLRDALDPESERRPPARVLDEMRGILEHHGGTVEESIGNAMTATFGAGLLHEDDALRAVRAASEVRDALVAVNQGAGLDRQVIVRIGLNTGEVVARTAAGATTLVMGDLLTAAARLAQAAGRGEVLLAEATYRLVRWAVDAAPTRAIEPAFRLGVVTAGVTGHAQRFDSPLVGRDREMRLLEAALEQATVDETCHLFSLLGPAGVGKSRLVHEFLQSARRESVVARGRCLPYGERVAFGPVSEAIRQAVGITDADLPDIVREKIATVLVGEERAPLIAQRIAAMIGVSDAPSTSEETFWAIRSVLEGVARSRPLVIVLDDLQWAEPALLDLIDHVADTSRGVPMLLLCVARPELLDDRPGWGGGHANATSVMLRPLAEEEVSVLVRNLLGGAGPSAQVERRIVDAAEGNPLFVEEFLAMLLEDGVLRSEGGEWVATSDITMIATPASIMALLASRLDRLPAEERAVLERAAVVGKTFTRGAVEALLDHDAHPDVEQRLGSLLRREIIRPDRAAERPNSYRFKHILIRDAAYARLSKRDRIALHERFAGWLEAAEQDAHVADEVIASHLEQAYRYRTELGPLDERAQAIGRLAATRLAAVGRRAHLWDDARTAADLLQRALVLLPTSDRQRLALLIDLTEVLIERGEFAQAGRTNDELLAEAAAGGFEDLRHWAVLHRIYFFTAHGGSEGVDDLRSAIRYFEGIGDERALALAWFVAAEYEIAALQLAKARVAHQRAVEHARRAGDVHREARALVEITMIDLYGPATVAEAERTATDLLQWSRTAGHLWTEAIALAALARLHAMVGRFAEARRLLESAVAMYREMGRPFVAAVDIAHWTSLIEELAGDPHAAEQALRRGFEELEQLGIGEVSTWLAPDMSRMLYEQGRIDEALHYTQIAETKGTDLELKDVSEWRGVRAMIMAERGDPAAAVALGREVLANAETTDDVWGRARALEDLAATLELMGNPDEARQLLEQAIGLYAQKGITVLADRTRHKLEDLARP